MDHYKPRNLEYNLDMQPTAHNVIGLGEGILLGASVIVGWEIGKWLASYAGGGHGSGHKEAAHKIYTN